MEITRFDIFDSESEKSFFDVNGFVIFKNAFTKSCLEDFRTEVGEIIKAHLARANISTIYGEDEIFDLAMNDLENKGHKYIASIYDTIFQCPSFFRIISEKSLTDSVRLLFDNHNVPLYGYTNRCRIDPPRDESRTYGWHQEVFYTVPRGNYLQTWAPLLRNSTVKNGTIQVAVGSHKEGIAKQTWNEVDGRATQILVDWKLLINMNKNLWK